jgi:hypothetical protein
MLAVEDFHVDCAITLRRLYLLFALDIRDRPIDAGHRAQQPAA